MKHSRIKQNSIKQNIIKQKLPITVSMSLTLLSAALLTVAFCLWGEHYLSRTAQDMQQPLADIEAALLAADWQQAGLLHSSLDHDWQHARKYWLGLGTHQEVADIDTALLSLRTFIQLEQKEDACDQLQLLRYFIIAPVDGNKLNWSNIF